MTRESISRSRFIRLGGALSLSVAGASLLASCGGGNGGDEGGYGAGENSGETGGGTSVGGSGPAIAQASNVETNSAVQFQNGGEPAVLIHMKSGDFKAYSAVCTHQSCTVSYVPGQGTLNCPCHGSVFDPAQGGKAIQGPAQRPLPDIPIKMQSGKIVRA